MDIYIPFAPHLASFFNVSDSTIKLSFLIGPITSCLVSLPCGLLSDRYGRRPVIIFGTVVWEIGMILCGSAMDISTFFIGRAFQSVGVGCLSVLIGSVLADLFQGATLARKMSIYSTLFPITFALAPIVGAQIGIVFGWRWVFFAMAIGMAIVLLLVYSLLPETRRQTNVGLSFERPSGSQIKMMLTAAFPATLGAIFTVNAPFLFVSSFHFDPFNYSLLQALPISVLCLGGFCYRRWIKNRELLSTFKVGLATSSIFTICASCIYFKIVPAHPFEAVGLLGIYVFGLPFITATASTILMDTSSHKGFTMSVVNMLRNLLLALVVSWSALYCDDTLFPMLGCMAVIAAGTCLLLLPSKKAAVLTESL